MKFIPDNECFHDGGPYHIETSPLICSACSVMKELMGRSCNYDLLFFLTFNAWYPLKGRT